jgi:hypothetical protein
MSDHAMFVQFLEAGLVIPRNSETSATVKELFDAGWIKAEQIEDCETGKMIWVCNGLSDEAKNVIYQRNAQRANAEVQAQLRAVTAPFLKMPVPPDPELAAKFMDIRRDLEKAIRDIKLY